MSVPLKDQDHERGNDGHDILVRQSAFASFGKFQRSGGSNQHNRKAILGFSDPLHAPKEIAGKIA